MPNEEQRPLEELLDAAGRSAQPTHPGWEKMTEKLASRPQRPRRRARLWWFAPPAGVAAAVVLFLLFGPGGNQTVAGPITVERLDVELTILSVQETDGQTLYMPLLQRLGRQLAGDPVLATLGMQRTGQALVKDRRLILNLQKGDNVVRFADVAASIDPTSVRFVSTTDPVGTKVVEQNFEYDLVTADALLAKYVDRKVVCVGRDGSETSGNLASYDPQNLVLWSEMDKEGKKARRTEVVARSTVRAIRLDEVPPGLLTRPTLVWKLRTDKPGRHDTVLTYLCGHIQWEARYVAVVTPGRDLEADRIDLTGWVSLNNQTGSTYDQARLKLIAGDVNRMRDPWAPVPIENNEFNDFVQNRPNVDGEFTRLEKEKKEFVEKSFYEYHLYTLQAPSTLRDRQTKQLNLLQRRGIKAERRYVYDAALDSRRAAVELVVKNEKENNLGLPLPRGQVSLQQRDLDGEATVTGGQSLDHTAVKEELTLRNGMAFDVTGQFREVEPHRYEMKVRNHKTDTIRARAVAYVAPPFKVANSSQSFTRHDFQTYRFDFTLKPNEEHTVTYSIEMP
jgi:hypothetical protein